MADGTILPDLFGKQPTKKRRKPFPRSPNAAENNRRYKGRLKERDVIETPSEKKCSGCGTIKPAAEFNRMRSEKDGLKRQCKECQKEARRKRVESPKISVAVKKCSRCNKELPASFFFGRSDSRDKLATHCKACERMRFLPWYEENRDRVRLASLEWASKNPDAARAARQMTRQRRRVREARLSEERITSSAWRKVLEHFNFRCGYCLGNYKQCGRLTVEHMLPISRGGDNNIENLIPACRRCNGEKGSKNLLEFLLYTAARRSAVNKRSTPNGSRQYPR